MAIATASLKTAIENAFKANAPSANATQEAQITALATALSDAMETWILTATVTTPLGIPVTVAGPLVGATTSPGIGTIS